MSEVPQPTDMEAIKKGFRLLGEMIQEAVADHALPPPSPGRGKRQADESYRFHAAISAALAKRQDLHPVIAKLMENGAAEAEEFAGGAMKDADPAALRELQEGLAAVAEAEARHAGFSRHVVAVLSAKRELHEEASGTDPFKGDVRKRAETILRKQGVSPFTGDDRWKEIFAAAGLSYLTQKRVPRSK